MKRVTLELGGKSPVVVFPDADIEAATQAISRTIFFKTGQFCMAGTRLFAHEKVFDEIASGFEDLAAKSRSAPGIAPTPRWARSSRRSSSSACSATSTPAGAGRASSSTGGERDRARRLLRAADAARERAARHERVPGRDLRARARARRRSATRASSTGSRSRRTTRATVSRRTSGRATSATRSASRAASRPATSR